MPTGGRRRTDGMAMIVLTTKAIAALTGLLVAVAALVTAVAALAIAR